MQRLIAKLLSIGLLLFHPIIQISAQTWIPPKGIPHPAKSFRGFDPINNSAPVVNNDGTCSYCPNWPSSANVGCYYVNNNHPSATDADNPYGYPNKPRKTIPEGKLNAGDFVYIAGGGTYVANGIFDWSGRGKANNPIWITGDPANPCILDDEIRIGTASYLVLQYFIMTGRYSTLSIKPDNDGDTTGHIVIRHFTLTGTQEAANNNGILVGWSQGTDPQPNSLIKNTVIYDGIISNFGDKSTTDEAGVIGGYHTDSTWIMDCIIHDVGADAIAGCHYNDGITKKTEHYFIGRITTYNNGENGIDLKGARYVVISECTIYGPFTREQGWGIVLHYGASPSTSVKDAWVIFNKIYHVSGGIYTSWSVGCDNLNVIGNLIYDVDTIYAAQSDPQNGYCVFVSGGDGTYRIVDNTFYNYHKGIFVKDLDGSDSLYIHGNIFANKKDVNGIDLKEQTDEARIKLDYNLYYHPENANSAIFDWAGSLRDLSYMKNTVVTCTHDIQANPEFSNPTEFDFSLGYDSPCKDASVEGPVGNSAYDAFYSMFGENIKIDYAGTPRPQNGIWDIGAFEYLNPESVKYEILNIFCLYQNYPNPFNTQTTIKYTITDLMNVELKIFDIVCHEIIKLIDGIQAPGEYTVKWDGNNSNGQKMACGIYYYQLKTDNKYTTTKKMVIFK